MASKSRITVTSRANVAKDRMAAAARNPVLAKRLAGNLHGGGNSTLPLKEPGRWYTRIENQLADPNMFYRMRHEMGYEPLTAADLNCTPQEAGFREENGVLVRGAVGHEEMVFKMATEDRAVLEQAMTQANLQGIGSAKKIKADLAEAAGAQLGSEAGDYINGLSGSVIDQIGG
jgi:hypothetical protein